MLDRKAESSACAASQHPGTNITVAAGAHRLRPGPPMRTLRQRHNGLGRRRHMQRIVVLNPKGGSGKTTIAINLASYFAQRGERLVLMGFDPQASSAHWLT